MPSRAVLLCCAPLAVWIAAACGEAGAPARVDAPADSAAGEVPFQLAGPGGAALIVPVHIGGEGPFDFVLDTGATLTCVEETLSERLALSEPTGVVGAGAGVQGAGRMRLVQIDSLRVGAATAQDLLACELDLQHIGQLGLDIQGLLGLNFLRSFRVTLDFERSVVGLQDPSEGGT